MAITTYAAFTAALGNLTVTGVNRKYDHIPASLSDLPCSWVQLPQSEEGLMTFDGTGGWPMLRAQLIIAVEAVAQNTPKANWDAVIAIIDNLSTALRGVAAGEIAKQKPLFNLRMISVQVAGIDYWAVEATVTAYG